MYKRQVVDSAIESLNLRKVCTIISKYPEQVEEFIINDLHRSATEQKAFGIYTKKEQKVMMTVLTLSLIHIWNQQLLQSQLQPLSQLPLHCQLQLQPRHQPRMRLQMLESSL